MTPLAYVLVGALAAPALILVGVVAYYAAQGYAERRRHARWLASIPRATLIRVGVVDDPHGPGERLRGWIFRFACEEDARWAVVRDADGRATHVCGWPISELREIASRRSEWQDADGSVISAK